MSKRHDINPPAQLQVRPSTEETTFVASNECSDDGRGDGDGGRSDGNGGRGYKMSSLVLSESRSAKSRRLTYKQYGTSSSNVDTETLTFLKQMEENNEGRERNREKRADEINSILREFLKISLLCFNLMMLSF